MSTYSNDKKNENDETLIDASLLEGLTEEERREALQAAAIAKRAEERAEERALERARKQKELERLKEKQEEEDAWKLKLEQKQQQQHQQEEQKEMFQQSPSALTGFSATMGNNKDGVVFIPKRKRNRQGGTIQETNNGEKDNNNSNNNNNKNNSNNNTNHSNSNKKKSFSTTSQPIERKNNHPNQQQQQQQGQRQQSQDVLSNWTEKDLAAVKESYLGKSTNTEEYEKAEKRKKQRSNKKITFRFKWDDTDDTFNDDDPLYASILPKNRHHHQHHTYRRGGMGHNSSMGNRHRSSPWGQGGGVGSSSNSRAAAEAERFPGDSVYTKPLQQMTARDWRIFRENYEIVVRGGRAPPPIRNFHESLSKIDPTIPPLHPTLLNSLRNVMGFKEPTPIQRQAIPIGLKRRDLIGIAETGSGKTVAFGIPLCNYILHLPSLVLDRVSEEGPLALVMAPTRELALQIDGEFTKLLTKQKHIKNCAIVGGQQIQHQAYQLRKGVHIVVGTPGRINECIEMAYLVLNQCYYVVLDEADRMIDMGFQPQIESIMDSMGGLLKSENELETYQQEIEDVQNLLQNSGSSTTSTSTATTPTIKLPRHRVTAMFSATMPLEVEKIAKRYLRHPAVVSIGDHDSSKNARIEQRIIFLSNPSQKENALRDVLMKSSFFHRNRNRHYHHHPSRGSNDEKIIVFVNEKKHADGLGRTIERILSQGGNSNGGAGTGNHLVVVLHGGKSQEQREESLAAFRKGGVIMVATDVAGRGLDIPDVSHVINYDLPTRSIENYSHRIGRTGRAGKDGLATSFITDHDETIMAPLKSYLESTGNHVPPRLANHPAVANASVPDSLIH